MAGEESTAIIDQWLSLSCLKLEPKHKIFLIFLVEPKSLLLSSCAKIWKHIITLLFTSSVSQGTYTEPRQYMLPHLQFVTIDGLSPLECRLPSFSPFTSLKFLKVRKCGGLTRPPSVQHCSGLERVWLSWH